MDITLARAPGPFSFSKIAGRTGLLSYPLFSVLFLLLAAIALGAPTAPFSLKSLGKSTGLLDRPIAKIEQLGSPAPVAWSLADDALTITPAAAKPCANEAVVFKLTLR